MDVDDDGNDNDDGGVDDDDGVNINDDNDANGGDSMSKAEYHDNADDGGGNSNNDGSIDGDVLFGDWCVDGEGGEEFDYGDEQSESVASDLAECNRTSKMEMTVGVIQWGILKERQR